MSRFANGIHGKSIWYKDQWMVPQEFENHCECSMYSELKGLDNIQSEYGALKTLIQSEKLRPHSRKCRCYICGGKYGEE